MQDDVRAFLGDIGEFGDLQDRLLASYVLQRVWGGLGSIQITGDPTEEVNDISASAVSCQQKAKMIESGQLEGWQSAENHAALAATTRWYSADKC